MVSETYGITRRFRKDNKFWMIRNMNRDKDGETWLYLQIQSGRIGGATKYTEVDCNWDVEKVEEWRNIEHKSRIQSKLDKGYTPITKQELDKAIKAAQQAKSQPALKKNPTKGKPKTSAKKPILIIGKAEEVINNLEEAEKVMNKDKTLAETSQAHTYIKKMWGVHPKSDIVAIWRGTCKSSSGGKFWETIRFKTGIKEYSRTRWGKLSQSSPGKGTLSTIKSSTCKYKFQKSVTDKIAKGYQGSYLSYLDYIKAIEANIAVESHSSEPIPEVKKKKKANRASNLELD